YRSYLMPNLYSDAPDPEDRTKASFIGFDSKMHSAHGFNYYSDLSLWDTFRTVHPLYVLIDQKSQSDMIQSLLSMAETGGTLPRWPSGAGYSSSMLGHPAAIMISESYLKGIRNFDARKALKFMVKSTSPKSTVVDRFGNDVDEYGKEFVDEYIKFGYCPSDTEESVSRTLEYSYADYSIYRLARELGESKIIDEYYQRSQNYKNLWNDQLKLFAPKKSDGHFIDSVSLTDTSYIRNTETGKAFVEGGANQWRWYLPQEPELLASMYGDQFIPQLNTFFENAKEEIGQMYPGVNYWHGNEPDLHASYLFNFGGRPDLTQKWVRWIIDHKYKASAQGLDGDDDAGTLSAWYVFSSLGFYPLAGTEKYVLGAPVVSNATVELDFIKGTKKLEIKVKNFSPSNIYVESVRMNGKLLNQPYITHAELALGGVLEFTMSAIPVNTFEGGAE
ncbi:MAG: glycoside hydrolase family 92 protein, partial [Bdellovibrionales bacterium]|nr:glycoside hydrolase family 92 protein [Bdellovibrionales bacterium]